MTDSAKPLLKLSLEAVLNNASLYASQIYFLPLSIKNSLLYVMSKRGSLNDNNIGDLLHKEVTEIDLTESDITDVGLTQLTKCAILSKIDLNSVRGNRMNITSYGLLKLFMVLKKLKIVYLRRCVLVDDKPICLLAKSYFLSQLNLGGCTLITDESIIALSHSHSLRCLNLSRTQVSDKGLFSLATGNCKNILTEVQVSNCHNVTNAGIESLSTNCKSLTILTFHGCPHVSMESGLDINNEEKPCMKILTWTVY